MFVEFLSQFPRYEWLIFIQKGEAACKAVSLPEYRRFDEFSYREKE